IKRCRGARRRHGDQGIDREIQWRTCRGWRKVFLRSRRTQIELIVEVDDEKTGKFSCSQWTLAILDGEVWELDALAGPVLFTEAMSGRQDDGAGNKCPRANALVLPGQNCKAAEREFACANLRSHRLHQGLGAMNMCDADSNGRLCPLLDVRLAEARVARELF